jgi:hypothetical protein
MATRRKAVTRRRYTPRSYRPIRRKSKMTLPVAVVAGFIPPILGAWSRRSNPTEVGTYLQAGFTGVSNGQFSLSNLRMGLLPVAAGFAVHTIASKLGVNRAIGAARIPFIRV